ncbi:MAG: M48 family metallopeptidase [Bacteroidota bacterium]
MMSRFALCIIFLIPLHSLAQLQYNYFPKENKASPAHLQNEIRSRWQSDMEAVSFPGKVKKEVEKLLTERYESLADRLDEEEFLFDDVIFPFYQSIIQKIFQANPSLPKEELRFLISKSRFPNASCLGEGTIIINLGLINRLEAEGQLAFAICHEIAHYTGDHVNEKIFDYAHAVNSKAFKQEIRNIRRQEYFQNKRLMDLLKDLSYDTYRHSRFYESDADSLGLQYFLKTSYDPNEAVRCMAILDRVDEPKYPQNIDFEKHFKNLSYPYKDWWDDYDLENDFFYSKDHIYDWDNDSLKTHPLCSDRIAALSQQLSQLNFEEQESGENLYNKFSELCDFKLIHTAYNGGSFGQSLFQSLLLLDKYPENTYLQAMVGNSLLRLHDSKKDHRLGEVLDMTGPKNKENYDRFLHFVRELRLKDLAGLAYAFLEKGTNKAKDDQFYLYSLILASYTSKHIEEGKAYKERYLNTFPDGIFTEEIIETDFTIDNN